MSRDRTRQVEASRDLEGKLGLVVSTSLCLRLSLSVVLLVAQVIVWVRGGRTSVCGADQQRERDEGGWGGQLLTLLFTAM